MNTVEPLARTPAQYGQLHTTDSSVWSQRNQISIISTLISMRTLSAGPLVSVFKKLAVF